MNQKQYKIFNVYSPASRDLSLSHIVSTAKLPISSAVQENTKMYMDIKGKTKTYGLQ